MQLGKHVYVQKPIAHDLYEARILTQAAKKI
jgi:predicted dehydrogenase